jgi:hypothetical protein
MLLPKVTQKLIYCYMLLTEVKLTYCYMLLPKVKLTYCYMFTIGKYDFFVGQIKFCGLEKKSMVKL